MKLSEFKQLVIELRGEKEWKKVENSNTYKIYKASEKEQLDAIRKERSDISDIGSINNPSEEVQLESIKKGPWNVMFIKNPTDKVIAEVLKSDIHIRTLIKDILRHIEDDLKEEK